jgi:hypothetical protein
MATYTLISSNVLTTAASNLTFSAIPQTYTDLVLRVSARSNDAGSDQHSRCYVRPNNSAYDPSYTYLYATGTTASSGREALGSQAGYRFQIPNAAATSNTFCNMEFYLPSYTVTQKKPSSLFSVSENNTTTTNYSWINATAGLMASSTTAITSLYIYDDFGQFIAGSSFYLYGISNA